MANTRRTLFRKEAILRHIQREDAPVIPHLAPRSNLLVLWLLAAGLMTSAAGIFTRSIDIEVPGSVIADASGLNKICISVPIADYPLIRPGDTVLLVIPGSRLNLIGEIAKAYLPQASGASSVTDLRRQDVRVVFDLGGLGLNLLLRARSSDRATLKLRVSPLRLLLRSF